MKTRKIRVLFVGAFDAGGERGRVGGQLFACRTLLDSPLSEYVEWIKLDSTMRSIPPPGLLARAGFAIRRTVRFCWILASTRVDGVLIFSSSGASFVEKGLMVLVARAAGRRTVFCPRSGLVVDEWEHRRLMRSLIPFVLRRSHLTVCQARSWADFYQKVSGLPVDRFAVIGNAVRTNAYVTRSARRDRSRVRVLFLGWTDRNKGVFDLIEIADRFRDQLTDTAIVICGQGAGWPELLRQVDQRQLGGLVDLRGWVDEREKAAVLAESDILILPSYYEGFPNALLEGMASGLAVIATRVGAVPEVIDDGVDGVLCEPGAVEQMGEWLVRLCRDAELRGRLGKAAAVKARRDYDTRDAWQKWLVALTADGRLAESVARASSSVEALASGDRR